MKRFILQLFSLLFCFGASTLQAQEKTCIDEIKQIYTSMEAKMNALSGKKFYMSITQTNKLTEKLGGQEHSSTMELTYNGNVSHLKSSEIEVVQDAQKTVSIIPNQRLVMINKSSLAEFKQAILMQTSSLYEEVFANAKVASCTKFKQSGVAFKRIVLDLSPEKQKELNVKQLIYTINVDQAAIQEVKVFYAPNAGQLEYMVVQFNQVSFDRPTATLSASPTAELYNSAGQLRSRFSGYKIVDNTK
jgi:hypothetical protein